MCCEEFSAAFHCVSHDGLSVNLRSLGVDGPALGSIMSQFMMARTHRVCVDGRCGIMLRADSAGPKGSVLDPYLDS